MHTIAKALIAIHEALLRELCAFEKPVRSIAGRDGRVKLLMTAPGVGAIVALTYVSAIDDPGRFSSSKRVGAHFGLTPRKYQSGETDITGRISKTGDAGVRAVLVRGGSYHFDAAAQGRGAEKLGHEALQADRDEEGQGCPCPQTRGDLAPDVAG